MLLLFFIFLLLEVLSAFLLPPHHIPHSFMLHPMMPAYPVQYMPAPLFIGPAEGGARPSRGCPMSPYSTFLSNDQQQTLHELIVEARGQGASEPEVKEHINKYLMTVLPPQRLQELQNANAQFELQIRGKRSSDKELPRKVFDMLDVYNGMPLNDEYRRFYEESAAKRIREN